MTGELCRTGSFFVLLNNQLISNNYGNQKYRHYRSRRSWQNYSN